MVLKQKIGTLALQQLDGMIIGTDMNKLANRTGMRRLTELVC